MTALGGRLDPLLLISFDGFFNIWYWLIASLVWSSTCHWTVGVPYDLLVRADRDGGQYTEDVNQLAAIHARRTTNVVTSGGVYLTGAIFFLLAILATFAFMYDYQLAQALFTLVCPLVFVHWLNARLGLRIARDAIEGEQLQTVLVKRRFWNQVIGLSAIIIAVLFAFVSFARQTVYWY